MFAYFHCQIPHFHIFPTTVTDVSPHKIIFFPYPVLLKIPLYYGIILCYGVLLFYGVIPCYGVNPCYALEAHISVHIVVIYMMSFL